ncbi:uncharacterized protein LOC121866514 isoform X2 [Homarus americanus]|uniref:uncharacterized protein LOC121866514 isoform X2 n=1 Tax=Homarus americanus TaxID=6706 RepID=UPI001C48B89F|nr:uncharacterized protein LOC121866514 isoform X2 [Homarus americanus]
MAASIRSVRLLPPTQLTTHRLNYVSLTKPRCVLQCRLSSSAPDTTSQDDILPPNRRFSFDAESLASRGYLRSQMPYSPPEDIENEVLRICKELLKSTDLHTPFKDANTKFMVLAECSKAYNHTVPNSLMHKITSIGELVTFYKTPINTTVPLNMMKEFDLPKNLHVIYKYTRFHPETDTMFGGVSAYTKDSTIVPGLKNKKRYPGYQARSTWPYQ